MMNISKMVALVLDLGLARVVLVQTLSVASCVSRIATKTKQSCCFFRLLNHDQSRQRHEYKGEYIC